MLRNRSVLRTPAQALMDLSILAAFTAPYSNKFLDTIIHCVKKLFPLGLL